MSRLSLLKATCPFAASLTSLAFIACSHTAALGQQTIPSIPLATFQNTMGVNTHMEYTDGKYANADMVLSDLQYIGIHNLRDFIPDPVKWLPKGQALAAMQMLAANGMKFDFVVDCNTDFSTLMGQLDTLLQTYPGIANSVEGPNEINNFACGGSTNNEPAAEALQRRIYSSIHNDPLAAGVPVYYLTGGAPINLQANPGLADVANTHPYPPRGLQPFAPLLEVFPSEFTMSGQYRKAITETGYATLPFPQDQDGVDEPAQAEMILNSYFDGALEGVEHTYEYQLLDPYADPGNNNPDNNYGFFHLDNSPKIIASALHHLAEVFPADKPSQQVAVHATITGLPNSTGHSLALTASDGSIAVFIWNEQPVWNLASQTMQLVTPLPVQVSMPGSWNVSYFTPAEDITTPMQAINGQYKAYIASYPTAIIFCKK